MATQIDSLFATGIAASALSAGVVVAVDSAANTFKVASSTDNAVGVAQNSVESGDPVSVKLFNQTYQAKLGGTVTRGNDLYVGTGGKLVTTGTVKVAIALENGANNEIIEVIGV